MKRERSGKRIQGSRMVRAYCYKCGDPIRITYGKGIPYCDDCMHVKVNYWGRWDHLTPRQWEALKKMGKGLIR
jgi:hypothetical protein